MLTFVHFISLVPESPKYARLAEVRRAIRNKCTDEKMNSIIQINSAPTHPGLPSERQEIVNIIAKSRTLCKQKVEEIQKHLLTCTRHGENHH